MPATQLAKVLEREYSSEWHWRFRRLSYEPVAAASIGILHRAQTHDGHVLALKIKNPGVRKNSASDRANLALLAHKPGLAPAVRDVSALLARVQAQLGHETDFRAAARAATEYRARLGDDPVLNVPAVADEHCTDHIIATKISPGLPVDRLTLPSGGTQSQRDHVAAEDPPEQTRGLIGMIRMAGEPMRRAGAYEFGASDLFARNFAQGRAQFFDESYARIPPPDLLFLQRKFAGTFMLCTRLRSSVDMAAVFAREL